MKPMLYLVKYIQAKSNVQSSSPIFTQPTVKKMASHIRSVFRYFWTVGCICIGEFDCTGKVFEEVQIFFFDSPGPIERGTAAH